MVPHQRWVGRIWADELMTVRVSRPLPRSVEIGVAGEVDLCTAPRLEDELRRTIGGEVDEVVVDLSRVSFLAVAGIGCLLRAMDAAEERGIGLHIESGDSRAVNRVFSLLSDTLPAAFNAPAPQS